MVNAAGARPSWLGLLGLATAGCSLLFDTEELHGEDGTGGESPTTSTQNGGGSTVSAGGAGGAPACTCEEVEGGLWLVRSRRAPPSSPPPACPSGSPAGAGAVDGTLSEPGSSCSAPCSGASTVKVAIDDSCGVSGQGLPNDGSCVETTLAPDSPGDTALNIILEPAPCTIPWAPLVDAATVDLARACEPDGGFCAIPAELVRCVPRTSEEDCVDPCYPRAFALREILDERDCSAAFATCVPPVVGLLELYDDPACAAPPVGSWDIAGAGVCPATPPAPASQPSHWTFTPEAQTCTATAPPAGAVSLGADVAALCCAPDEA